MSRPHPTGPVSLAGNPGHRDRHAGRGSCKSKASTQGRPPQGPPGQAGSHRGWGSPDGLSPDLAATCLLTPLPAGRSEGANAAASAAVCGARPQPPGHQHSPWKKSKLVSRRLTLTSGPHRGADMLLTTVLTEAPVQERRPLTSVCHFH